MSQKEFNEDELEAIRFENEFLKAKIMAEFGAIKIYFNTDLDIPPEIENEFLKAITCREGTREDVEEVPIYDYIGRPHIVKEQELSDDQLPAELERVIDLLDENNIICEAVCPVEDRVFYKFLTEEFFHHLILNIHDSQFGSHYFYEDFHPNHECDSRRGGEEFLNLFFSNNFHERIQDYYPENIRNFVELLEFRDCFNEFKNVEFELLQVSDVHPAECTRHATIRFDAITDPGTTPLHFEGQAILEMEYVDELWRVISAVLPGML